MEMKLSQYNWHDFSGVIFGLMGVILAEVGLMAFLPKPWGFVCAFSLLLIAFQAD